MSVDSKLYSVLIWHALILFLPCLQYFGFIAGTHICWRTSIILVLCTPPKGIPTRKFCTNNPTFNSIFISRPKLNEYYYNISNKGISISINK